MAKSLNALRSKSKTQTTRAKAPSPRQRGKAARAKPAYSQRSVAHTKINRQRSTIAATRKSAREAELTANLDRNITLAGTETSEVTRSRSFSKSASRSLSPVEIISEELPCSSLSDVIGRTEIPLSSIRNGYSFVPCVLPRYFMIRKRLVAI